MIERPYWHPGQAAGVLLDWDGVIAETSLDFSGIREKYFDGRRVPLLEAAERLPEERRFQFHRDVEALEVEGADHAVPVPGARELIEWLEAREKPWGIVSRNCRAAIDLAALRCGITLPPVTLSRDHGPVKPDPEALWLAAEMIAAPAGGCVFVGDFIYDLIGGRRAGMRTILVQRAEDDWLPWTDVAYPHVTDLVEALRNPEPLVPWEYQDVAGRRERQWLEKVWRIRVQVPPDCADPGCFCLSLAALGVGTFVVDPFATLRVDQWRRCPSVRRSFLGATLEEALGSLLEERYPMVKVEEGRDGLNVDPARNLEAQLEELFS